MTAENVRPNMTPDRSEIPTINELSPSPEVFDVLRGKISEPQTVTSFKTPEDKAAGGRQVEGVSLVQEGAGLWGLTDWRDSKEWSGIQNHTWMMTRAAIHFAQQVNERTATNIDIQALLDGGLVSHAGRRVWDEAGWYKNDAPSANVEERNQGVINEVTGMRLIRGQVSEGAFNIVVALGHELDRFNVDYAMLDSGEYRIAMWADHRTGQEYDTIANRMGDFLNRNFLESGTQTQESLTGAIEVIQKVVDQRKAMRRGEEVKMGIEEAVRLAKEFGASDGSERLTLRMFLGLMLTDANTEADLEALGIDTENFNEESIPMPAWERDIREQYVEFARESVFAAIQDRRETGQFEEAVNWTELIRYDKDFPKGNWWTEAAFNLFYVEMKSAGESIANHCRDALDRGYFLSSAEYNRENHRWESTLNDFDGILGKFYYNSETGVSTE